MTDESPRQDRRISDRYQAQLDTRAIEMSAQALEATKHIERRVDDGFVALREDLKEMRSDRATQHASAEAKFNSITKAQWTGAVSTILLLAGWVFYLATHQQHP